LHATSRFADESDQWTFMSAVLLGIFSTDISKAILAERLRRILAPNVLKWVFFAFGIVMIAFSIRAFLYGLTG